MTRLVLLTVVLSGCFIEATSGLYVAKDDERTRPTYGFGLAAGLYLDPGPARLSVGGGADFVKRSTNGVDSLNGGGSTYARLDVNTGKRLGASLPLRATVATSLGQGGVGVRGADGEYTNDESGGGWMAFAGLSTGLQAQALGIWVSVGPSLVSTHSDLAGDMVAVGPQVRVRLSGVVRGLGVLFAHSNYKPSKERPIGTRECTPTTVQDCSDTPNGRQCITRTVPCGG